MEKFKKFFSIFTHLIFILLIFSLAIFASLLFAFWQGYPSGFDGIGHLYRISFVSQFWPHVNWWPNWAAGMAHFLRYASINYIALGLFSRLSGVDVLITLVGAAVFAIGLGGVGIYLLVNQLTSSKLASLAGAFLYILTPTTWALAGRGGGYSRQFSLPFMILAIWAVTMVLADLEKKKERFWPYFLSSFFLGLCFLNQYIVGAAAFVFIFFWIFSFIGVIKFKQLFLTGVKIFLPAILISSPLWVPMLVFRDPQNGLAVGSINWADIKPVPWKILFNFTPFGQEINPYGTLKLSPFLYPLVAALSFLGIVFRLGRLQLKTFFGRSVWAWVLVTALSLVFLRTVTPLFTVLYAGVITHEMMFDLVPILAAITAGVLIVYTFSKKWLINLFSLFLIAGVCLWAGFFYHLPQRGWAGLTQFSAVNVGPEKYPFIKKAITNPENFNFRFGTSTDADLAAWFNIAFPYVPQTRDYFATGIVDVDNDVYKTHVLWEQDQAYPETEFILDWFGVDKFVVTSGNQKVVGKYEARPDLFTPFDGGIFAYQNPSAILTGTNTIRVLVVGRDTGDIVLRSLAQGNINSQKIIPFAGSEKIDDYQINDLKKFDLVILYNYQYKNKETAFDFLAKYVRGGGGLFIESNNFVEKQGELSEPFPMSSIKKQSFKGAWQLDSSVFFGEIDPTKFSPPVYQDGPWGGATALGLKNWAQVLVNASGEPLVVGGDLGSGRVVWSGMNLFYHVLNNHNEEEAKLLEKILAWTKNKKSLTEGYAEFQNLEEQTRGLTYETKFYTAKFINPEEFRLTLKIPLRGALFKDFYFPGWQASVVDEKKKVTQIPIYKVGPGMMYAVLPGETKEVIFRYQVPKIVTLAKIVSILTIILLISWPFLKKAHLPFLKEKTKGLGDKASGWWNKDEG